MTVDGDNVSVPKSLFWGAVLTILTVVGAGGFYMGGMAGRLTNLETAMLAFSTSTHSTDASMAVVSGHLEKIQAQIDFLITRDAPRQGDKR